MTRAEQARGGRANGRPVARRSQPGLLGVVELAERLGTSERFVRRLVLERRVPFHKVGKYVRFEPRDIEDWLASNRTEARSRSR